MAKTSTNVNYVLNIILTLGNCSDDVSLFKKIKQFVSKSTRTSEDDRGEQICSTLLTAKTRWPKKLKTIRPNFWGVEER